MAHLVQRHAHDAALERRDPLQLPTPRQAGDLRDELRDRLVDALGELARERLRAFEQLRKRAAGHLALVEREGRIPALVGASHAPEATRAPSPNRDDRRLVGGYASESTVIRRS